MYGEESFYEKNKGKIIGVIGLFIFVVFVVAFFAMINNDKAVVEENILEEKEVIEEEIIDEKISEEVVKEVETSLDKEAYFGDIHFQIGLGQEDSLILTLNDKVVFDSNVESSKGGFQKQIFDTAIVGENILKVDFNDVEDDNPVALFVIKDGADTILNWDSDLPLESGNLKFIISK